MLQLTAWANVANNPKTAFVDPAAVAGGGMPPGMPPGAPPMDPAMMAGGMPPGAPPMDPAMMAGGAPPMDPAMMAGGMPMGDPMMAMPPEAGPPPADPSAQAMGDQEAIRNIIREEIQKAMGGGLDPAAGGMGGPKKGGNKIEEIVHSLEEKMKEQTKIFVTALRKQGVEIPLADLYAIEQAGGSLTGPNPDSTGQVPPNSAPGISEGLATGLGGASAAPQPGKIAGFTNEERVQQLRRLGETKDQLKRSAMGSKFSSFDPHSADLGYLAGLWR